MSRVSTSGGVVVVTVTGARGSPGATGDITPALTALQADVTNKANAAATSATNAGTAAGNASSSAAAAAASAASIPAPASQAEVDAASANKTVTANRLGKIEARLRLLESVSSLPHTAATGPIQDSFVGDGALHNRKVSDGELTWQLEWATPTPTPGSLTAMSTSNGKMGSNGAGDGRTMGSLLAASPTNVLIRRGISTVPIASAQLGHWDHVSFNAAGAGTTKFSGIRITSAFAGTGNYTGNVTFTGQNGGGASSPALSAQALGCTVYSGDRMAEMYLAQSGTTYLRFILNGRIQRADLAVSGYDFSLTGKFGTAGIIGPEAVEDYALINLTGDAYVVLYSTARVRAIESDNASFIDRVRAYYGGTLKALSYSLIDETSGNVVAGQSDVLATNFVENAGSGLDANGKLATARTQAAAVGAGPYHIDVFRDGVVTAGGALMRSYDRSPSFRVGHVVAITGQSNAYQLHQENELTTATIAQPAQGLSWRIEAAGQIAAEARYQHVVSGNTALAQMHATINAVTGRATAFIGAGLSGSSIATRTVGSVTHNGLRDGILHGGMNLNWAVHVDGENDALGGTQAGWGGYLDEIWNDIVALIGHEIPVVISLIGSAWGTSAGTDAAVQAMRRAQWAKAQGSPRYVLAHKNDLQHKSGDQLHYTPDDQAEHARRVSFAAMKKLGLVANDRNGPSMASASKVSSSVIRVTFDLNGASGLELVNSAYASIFSGGLGFATSSAFSSLIAPSGFTINAAAGGQQSIDFAFSGTPFTGTAYVRGPYGKNPFNPSDDATTNADMANRASMIRGLFSGERSVPVQPYFHASGNDYLTAA